METKEHLSAFQENAYDITWLLGPMYPLFRGEEQQKALAQMEEEMYQLYLKYHFATCQRQDIFRKD